MKYNTIRSGLFLLIMSVLLSCFYAGAQSEIRFSFERAEKRGWEIPDWAIEQGDHVGQSLEITSKKASDGDYALELTCDFPRDVWSAAVIEYAHDMNLAEHGSISVDVFIPAKARSDLFQVRMMMTIGDGWWFVEQRKAVLVKRGKWNTITASLNDEEIWRCRTRGVVILDNLNKVRKIAIRVEQNANPWQAGNKYKGPIYIDNIVIK